MRDRKRTFDVITIMIWIIVTALSKTFRVSFSTSHINQGMTSIALFMPSTSSDLIPALCRLTCPTTALTYVVSSISIVTELFHTVSLSIPSWMKPYLGTGTLRTIVFMEPQ